jgi:hypothetical protein
MMQMKLAPKPRGEIRLARSSPCSQFRVCVGALSATKYSLDQNPLNTRTWCAGQRKEVCGQLVIASMGTLLIDWARNLPFGTSHQPVSTQPRDQRVLDRFRSARLKFEAMG